MDEKYLIIILVLAILFGASRLPSLGRNFGQGIREFKKGIGESRPKDLAEGKPDDDAEEVAPTPPEDDRRTAS